MINLMGVCGYGGTGRRAGFRFRWETVEVRVLLAAEIVYNSNRPDIRIIGDAFGFLLYVGYADCKILGDLVKFTLGGG